MKFNIQIEAAEAYNEASMKLIHNGKFMPNNLIQSTDNIELLEIDL